MSDSARMLIQQAPWPAVATNELPSLQYAASAAEPNAKLREILRAFRRRARMIVFTLLALNAIAFVTLTAVKPRYTAEATVLIGPRQEQVLDLKSVLAGLGADTEAIESEVQMLRSRKVAQAVVQQLQLASNPEFVAPNYGPGPLTMVKEFARTSWNRLVSGFAPSLRLPERTGRAEPDRVRDPVTLATETFLRRASVTARGHSRVVAVTFDSADPELAAAAANGIVDTYIADQLRAKRDATASAHRWLEDRVAEMREQVINADQQVAAYRRKAAITQGRTGTLLSEQISTLGEQVVQARVAGANASARLKALEAGTRPDSLPEVQASPTIQALRAQEGTLHAQIATVSGIYGEGHPKVTAARAAASAVAGRIAAETSKIVAALQDEARTARAREASMSNSLLALRQEVDVGTESEVELHALQHEAEANRALYDRLLARSRETHVEGGLQKPDAQVISKADAPELPSFPNPVIILPIFFLASCIATVLLVFAVEAMDSGFMTLEQVEATTGVAALGVLPRIRSARRMTAFLWSGRHGSSGAGSAYSEAVRSLHTSLMLANRAAGSDRPKVVLVASALPGEGRSTVVLSLARLMASCGTRVVVVDCDLRRPDLHRACGVASGPGLTDCLVGGTPVHDVLQGDRSSPAYVVAAGTKGATAPDLFASDAMRGLIASLSDRFDLVLLDSSPVLAVSETRNLCRLADTTMFVVRWSDTRRVAAVAGLRKMLEVGGRFAGVVLSNVDLKRYAQYSSTGAYQRRIGLYLSE